MVSGFELRFATALRDWIQDQRSQFFEEFDAIDLSQGQFHCACWRTEGTLRRTGGNPHGSR